MNNRLTFVIEAGQTESNPQLLLDCTLATLYIPDGIAGRALRLVGSLDGFEYYPLDVRFDLTQSEKKGVMITNLQPHCCGLRAVKMMSDSVQATRITLLGGVLC